MHLLKMPQLFIRVGRNQYAPVDKPQPGQALYVWDDKLHKIVPYGTSEQTK